MRPVFFLLLSIFFISAHAQQIVSVLNFLKSPKITPDHNELWINAQQEPGYGYLNSFSSAIPINLVPGWHYCSASIIRSSTDGTRLSEFTVPYDSAMKQSFVSLGSFLAGEEVIWLVSMDSSIHTKNSISQSLIIYHLDSGNLSFKSADTFVTPL